MEYKVSAIGKGESTFTVDDAQLSVLRAKTGQSIDIPFSEVDRVRLIASQGIFYTYLFTTKGKFKIVSRSFRGIRRYEDKHAEYRGFVKEFHDKLCAANPDVTFSAGSTAMYVLGWILIVLGMSGFVLRWGFGLRGTLPIGIGAAIGVPLIILGKAKTYSPDKIPEKYMP